MDREKVIKGLECCIEWDSCNKCPYETPNEYDIAECALSLHKDALALLKEQDPVETELEGGGSSWWYVCGDCHGTIDQRDNYCKHCGRRIKHAKKAE